MAELIDTNYGRPGIAEITYDEEAAIRDLLLGHSVAKVADDHLQLDDGTILKVVPNEGGCACSAGDYFLRRLGETENVITGVEFDYAPADDYDAGDGHYRVFVYAGADRINLVDIEGNDGNGYYGTGYWFLVRKPGAAS